MLYSPFFTELPPETIAKIPAGKYGLIDVHTTERALNAPSGSRPRIYAYLERGEYAGQIVKLSSLYYLEKYEGDIGFAWTSANSLEDLTQPA